MFFPDLWNVSFLNKDTQGMRLLRWAMCYKNAWDDISQMLYVVDSLQGVRKTEVLKVKLKTKPCIFKAYTLEVRICMFH